MWHLATQQYVTASLIVILKWIDYNIVRKKQYITPFSHPYTLFQVCNTSLQYDYRRSRQVLKLYTL